MAVLRLMTVYNEKDIIRENLEYFINQGIESIVLDNYSKDGTYEILKEYEGKGIRWIERYKTDFFDIVKLNKILLDLAFKEKEDYFIWIDADEILTVFDSRLNLRETIVTLLGDSNVDCFSASKVEFYYTDKEDLYKESASFNDFKYFKFSRNWKNVIFKRNKNIKNYIDGPHYDEHLKDVPFNVINDIFYLKHYPFRSLRQAKKKIYRGLPRSKSPNVLNNHLLYYKEDMENKIVQDKTGMTLFQDYPTFLMDFTVEKFPELEKFYEKVYDILK